MGKISRELTRMNGAGEAGLPASYLARPFGPCAIIWMAMIQSLF
jgi:hypothetical protein